jgi:hypothetical protein
VAAAAVAGGIVRFAVRDRGSRANPPSRPPTSGAAPSTAPAAASAEPAGRAPVASVPGGAGGSTGSGSVAADTPKVKVERGAGGKKIYRITEDIRIEGKIQKPEAFFFYQKSSINYDWQELKQDFLPRILESVNRAPF